MNLTKPLRLDSCRAEKVNRDTVRSRRTKHVVVNSILKGGPPLRVCRRDRSVGFEMVPLEKKEVGRARAAARAWTARPRPAGSDMILEKRVGVCTRRSARLGRFKTENHVCPTNKGHLLLSIRIFNA